MKECRDCGAILTGENSYRSKANVTRNNPEGYSSYCRECHQARAKINRQKIDKVCPLCECSFVGSTGRKYCHECSQKRADAKESQVRKGPEQRNVNKATVIFKIVSDPGPGGFRPGATFGLDEMRNMLEFECLNHGTQVVVEKGSRGWKRGKYFYDASASELVHITGNIAIAELQPAPRTATVICGRRPFAHATTIQVVRY